jgi:dTDP-4-amino-4,6-dideoxygalactose transaminase
MNAEPLPEDPFMISGSPLIEQAESEEVVARMNSAWLGTGPRVARFERDFAFYQRIPETHVDAIAEIARKHDLLLMEDCAHARNVRSLLAGGTSS